MTSEMETIQVNSRFTLHVAAPQDHDGGFADSVRDGLMAARKVLEPKYFYDKEGSIIFEEITALEEYYPTRAEQAILDSHHSEIRRVFWNVDEPILVELGSGSSAKTRRLISSIIEAKGSLVYVPIDISQTMLRESSEALLKDFPALKIVGVAAEYTHGLRVVSQLFSERPKLVIWLGSSIGNLLRNDAVEFLQQLKEAMTDSDHLLIGMDLKKDVSVLLAAYNDSLGVTARFNKNLLHRINATFHGNFDVDGSFRHESIWNEADGRIEMHLWSTKPQHVHVADLDMDLEFKEGESIHTENSHKYSLEDILDTGSRSGFALEKQWFDPQHRFSLNLFSPTINASA